MPSKYEQIDGVKCDRAIIDMCKECTKGAGDGRVSEADAKKVFAIIMENSKVTRTERWTVRYCLTTFNFTQAAIGFLNGHMKKAVNEDLGKEPATKKRKVSGKSYYETIDGEKLDTGIVDACREAVAGQGDGRVSVEDAEKVWVKVADAKKVTKCERWTMRYCLAEFSWTQGAQESIVSKMSELSGGSGIEVLSGKAQKRQKGPQIADYVDIVKAAVKDKKSCEVPGPDENRAMLVSMAKSALTQGHDERHAYQQAVADMIAEVLTKSIANWEQKLADAHAGVTAAEQGKESAAAALKKTTEELEQKRAQVGALKETLAADTEGEKAAEASLKNAVKEVADFDANQKEKIKMKEECAAAITNDFEGKKASDSLEKVLKTASGDGSLINSLFAVFKKGSAEVSSFEQMVVSSAQDALKKHLAELTQAVENGESAKEEKVNEKDAAAAAVEAATAKKVATAEALKTAQEEQKSLEAAEKGANKDLETAQKAATKAVDHVDDAEMGLDTARDQLDTCTFLNERIAAPPEPEPAEPAAPE